MKIAYVLGAVLAVLIVAGLVWHLASNSSQPTSNIQSATPAAQTQASQTTQTAPTNPNTQGNGSVAPSAAPAPQHFTVNGNDETADLKQITVPAGTKVSITFGADAGSTYHGGLDFRSSVISTGTIAPGSTKTITFTATKSFSFTPYWPATNIAKPYTINIVVQ